ncbi:bifunctional protein-serine/threonine kinase/phosphatase [Endozoicomonas ascidiicola]|uniref:bifunctional protein-serine/threonine kinase/phosphatase n=1 Tax=Endozoicomonas ascidiicola TaxID=1698521 RepID=UPI00082E7F9A|nr:bifunctional protein-serine/threonine kinase/phosphatase [Endozoicomonas ascidiicola]
MKKLTVDLGQHSDKGRKARNQDAYGARIPDGHLLETKGIAIAIADGISSSDVSHIASHTAISSFLEDYYSTPETWSVKTSAHRVIQAINSWLFAQSQRGPNRFNKDKGYISTFSALILKSNTAYIFHLGDSRIYRYSQDNLEQLTADHRREVSKDISYLTNGLGVQERVKLDYIEVELNKGDHFLLTTDGIHEHVSLLDVLKEQPSGSLNALAEKFGKTALNNSSLDNLTSQIIEVKQLPEKAYHEVSKQADKTGLPRLEARREIDGLKILRELYISSRSHVYLALDMQTQKEIVIKAPPTEHRENQPFLEALLMEEWVLRRMNHPHLVKAATMSQHRSYLYTTTEYIRGRTLAQWMIDNPRPDLTTVRDIISQIGKGLQALHRKEVIHQDLRPANIMIDGNGTVTIIDLGSCRIQGISEIKREINSIPGTAQYTAPEYYIGLAGSTRSDIFSLGVITYQLLTGKLPFGTEVARITSAANQKKLTYRPLSLINPMVPNWVDDAICKAVAVTPAKRYQEVSEFIHCLYKPDPSYAIKRHQPLIDRDPVRFWQVTSLVLAIIALAQHF